MTRLTVLVGIYSRFESWNIPSEHVERLRREFPDHSLLHATNEEEALAMIPSAEVIFMSELRPWHFARAERLRWLHSPAAGVGGMLFPEMVGSPVVMTNSRGISALPIAEHVLAVTLAIFRKLPLALASQQQRHWAQDEAMQPPPMRTIAGSRVLVVGLGSIGHAVATRFRALGAEVAGLKRHVTERTVDGIAVEPATRLLDLLPGADVVVLSAPQTGETRKMIGTREIAAMKRDALLVNVSRGKLVDEAALASALAERRIAAAALDVFEHEPLAAESPLWHLSNVLVTPHMSGFRPDHWDAVTELFADNLRRFVAGEPLLNVVDKSAGY